MLDAKALVEAPLRNLLQGAIGRAANLSHRLQRPGIPQWHNDAEKPAALVCHYGPIGLQAAGRVAGGLGFDKLAPLVDPSTYLTPDVNPLVTKAGTFRVTSVGLFSSYSWTWLAQPAGQAYPVDARPAAGLLEPAIGANGGAIMLNNFAGTHQFSGAPVNPRLCCELDVYDLSAGRSLTQSRAPAEGYVGLHWGWQDLPQPMDLPHGTLIEPRVYVTEMRAGSTPMGTDDGYKLASVAAHLQLVFNGVLMPGGLS